MTGYTVFDGKEGIDRLMLDISGALPKEDQDSRYGFSSVKNIYRKEVLEKNKIRFLSEKEVMSEDVFFLLDFLDKCECAVGVPGAFTAIAETVSRCQKAIGATALKSAGLLSTV